MKKNYFETIIGTLVLFFSVYAFLMFLKLTPKQIKILLPKLALIF